MRNSQLRSAATRYGSTVFSKSLIEAKVNNKHTGFLCHSHRDQELAKGLQVVLKEKGWDLYIDWEDTAMPETPNKETAQNIKHKIQSTDWFLFLATDNSTRSRWCPWEIGYADAIKTYAKIIVIPTEDDSGNWHGNEYLQLYKKLSSANNKNTGKSGYAVFEAASNSNGKWVENL